MVKKIVPIFILALLTALCLPGGEAMPADGGAEIPAGEKYVALTFDDGPRRGTTEPPSSSSASRLKTTPRWWPAWRRRGTR